MHFLCLATILAMADAPSPAHLTVAKNLPIAPVAEEPHGRNGIILIVGLIAAVAMSSVLIVATYYLHMIHKHQEKPFGDDNDDKDDDDEENGVSQGKLFYLFIIKFSRACNLKNTFINAENGIIIQC